MKVITTKKKLQTAKCKRPASDHQTTHFSEGFIGLSPGHLNASAKSCELRTAASTLEMLRKNLKISSKFGILAAIANYPFDLSPHLQKNVSMQAETKRKGSTSPDNHRLR